MNTVLDDNKKVQCSRYNNTLYMRIYMYNEIVSKMPVPIHVLTDDLPQTCMSHVHVHVLLLYMYMYVYTNNVPPIFFLYFNYSYV